MGSRQCKERRHAGTGTGTWLRKANSFRKLKKALKLVGFVTQEGKGGARRIPREITAARSPMSLLQPPRTENIIIVSGGSGGGGERFFAGYL